MRRREVDLNEWKLDVAEERANGKTILEAVRAVSGRDWGDDNVEHRRPTDPSTIGREHREESSDDQATPDVDAKRAATAEVEP